MSWLILKPVTGNVLHSMVLPFIEVDTLPTAIEVTLSLLRYSSANLNGEIYCGVVLPLLKLVVFPRYDHPST